MLKNKLPFIILFIAILGLLLWVFFVFKERNSLPAGDAEKNSPLQTQNNEQAQTEFDDEINEGENEIDSSDSDDETDSDEDLSDSDISDSEIEKTNLLEVSSQDCNNKCKDFSNSKELEYCREICNISTENEKSDESAEKNIGNCAGLSDLKKDYCLKDLAIQEKDSEICKKIEDSGIEKTCRNRITEDILDAK